MQEKIPFFGSIRILYSKHFTNLFGSPSTSSDSSSFTKWSTRGSSSVEVFALGNSRGGSTFISILSSCLVIKWIINYKLQQRVSNKEILVLWYFKNLSTYELFYRVCVYFCHRRTNTLMSGNILKQNNLLATYFKHGGKKKSWCKKNFLSLDQCKFFI